MSCSGSLGCLLSKLTLQPGAIFSSATLFTPHFYQTISPQYIEHSVSEYVGLLCIFCWTMHLLAGVGGYMLQGCVIRANTANTGAFLDEILTLLPVSWFLQCSQWPRINCHKRVVEGNMILFSDLITMSNVLKTGYHKKKKCVIIIINLS